MSRGTTKRPSSDLHSFRDINENRHLFKLFTYGKETPVYMEKNMSCSIAVYPPYISYILLVVDNKHPYSHPSTLSPLQPVVLNTAHEQTL